MESGRRCRLAIKMSSRARGSSDLIRDRSLLTTLPLRMDVSRLWILGFGDEGSCPSFFVLRAKVISLQTYGIYGSPFCCSDIFHKVMTTKWLR